jgi:hypothetical protein
MRFLTECRYVSTFEHRGDLVADFVVDLEKGYKGYHEFATLKDGVFATLDDDILTLKKGVKSDLCSPAFRIRGKWVGTHTGEKEAGGAFIHDVTRRVYQLHCVPFSRKDTDDFFWDALRLKKSRVSRTYHFFVSSFFGTIFLWVTLKKLDCYCKSYH